MKMAALCPVASSTLVISVLFGGGCGDPPAGAGGTRPTSEAVLLPRGGKCLDAQGNISAAGTPLILYDCWGGPNQAWQLHAAPADDGIVQLAWASPTTGAAVSSPVALTLSGKDFLNVEIRKNGAM